MQGQQQEQLGEGQKTVVPDKSQDNSTVYRGRQRVQGYHKLAAPSPKASHINIVDQSESRRRESFDPSKQSPLDPENQQEPDFLRSMTKTEAKKQEAVPLSSILDMIMSGDMVANSAGQKPQNASTRRRQWTMQKTSSKKTVSNNANLARRYTNLNNLSKQMVQNPLASAKLGSHRVSLHSRTGPKLIRETSPSNKEDQVSKASVSTSVNTLKADHVALPKKAPALDKKLSSMELPKITNEGKKAPAVYVNNEIYPPRKLTISFAQSLATQRKSVVQRTGNLSPKNSAQIAQTARLEDNVQPKSCMKSSYVIQTKGEETYETNVANRRQMQRVWPKNLIHLAKKLRKTDSKEELLDSMAQLRTTLIMSSLKPRTNSSSNSTSKSDRAAPTAKFVSSKKLMQIESFGSSIQAVGNGSLSKSSADYSSCRKTMTTGITGMDGFSYVADKFSNRPSHASSILFKRTPSEILTMKLNNVGKKEDAFELDDSFDSSSDPLSSNDTNYRPNPQNTQGDVSSNNESLVIKKRRS